MSQSSDEIEEIMLQSLPSDSMSSPESHAQDGQAPQDDDKMKKAMNAVPMKKGMKAIPMKKAMKAVKTKVMKKSAVYEILVHIVARMPRKSLEKTTGASLKQLRLD